MVDELAEGTNIPVFESGAIVLLTIHFLQQISEEWTTCENEGY